MIPFKHITFASPILGLMDPRVALSFVRTAVALDRLGVTCVWSIITQNAILPHARNTLVRQFLASESEVLFFIDADIRFDAEDVIALLERDEDFLGGLVATKNPQRKHNARILSPEEGGERKETAEAKNEGYVYKVGFIGTGFLRLTRKVLTDMVKACPETLYKDTADSPPSYALFDTGVMQGQYVGEDLMFCLRWRKMGGRCWVHSGLNLGHIGTTVYESKDLEP